MNKFIKHKDFVKSLGESINSLKHQKNIKIGLSGGSSLDLIYDDFVKIFFRLDEKIKQKIFFCFLDERIVPIDDKDSNYKSIFEKFFKVLLKNSLIQKTQILIPDIQNQNISLLYSKKVPNVDIALFGVGEDGHIASLFPYHNLLDNEENNFLEIKDSPKPPAYRITISKNMISKISYSFVFFVGKKKKDALDNFLNPKINYHQTPAKLLYNSKNCYLVSGL